MPWAGEFAGKYLISAVQALRICPAAALRDHLSKFVDQLVECQDEDGYLGPFPKQRRIFGPNLFDPEWNSEGVWDLWGHYHCMLGLYLWHLQTRRSEGAMLLFEGGRLCMARCSSMARAGS